MRPGTVAAFGIIAGIVLGMLFAWGTTPSGYAADTRSANAVHGNLSQTVIIEQKRQDIQRRHRCQNIQITGSGVGIAPGHTTASCVSPPLHLDAIKKLVINTSITAEDRSRSVVNILVPKNTFRTHNQPFRPHDWRMLGEKRFVLHPGQNVLTAIPRYRYNVYRIKFELSRADTATSTPHVSGYTVFGAPAPNATSQIPLSESGDP